jgi:hypothetical protein
MEKEGDALVVNYMAAFVIAIFGEAAFARYKVDFGTHNVLGHLYKPNHSPARLALLKARTRNWRSSRLSASGGSEDLAPNGADVAMVRLLEYAAKTYTSAGGRAAVNRRCGPTPSSGART